MRVKHYFVVYKIKINMTTLRYYLVIGLLLTLCIQMLSAAVTIRKQRSLATTASITNTSSEGGATTVVEKKEICQGRTPCGWAVYNRVTRYIDYFMRNKCICGEEKRCLRDDDDISITAYVYRCKNDDSQDDGSKSNS